ncbi:uncharacterized protein TNIN_384651 [Trichonephila inaurata madagascariensis]|uniref:Uncharacterized protein n=1 Tax=Trichonephila inaurata madagascariensis TaxID=2747483 RepID=A0A8X6X8X7_9ARAC|nr:uncharacterized protein TNIN_384651 [Trichonephila inaurata madagascariensis]
MLFITVFLVLFAFVAPYRGDLDHLNEYVDEVLSENLPRIAEKASLDAYEIPDFYFNVQDTLAEAEEFEGTVLFHSGNLTGLNAVNRRFCRYLSRSSDNNRIVCNVVLPRVGVRYRGRYEATTGLTTSYGVRVQQRDFYSEILFRDVEAQIELTKLNDSERPSITNLLLLGEGEVMKRFLYNEETKNRFFNRFYVSFHEISGSFHQKCAHLFQKIFYGSYREVLEKAFSTVEYPEHY